MRIAAVLLTAAAFGRSPAEAQAPTLITEAAFLEALDGPAARLLAEGTARAEAARRQAGLLANPRLEAEREAPESNPTQTTWSLAWTPPLDGRRGLAVDAAEAGLLAARARQDAERLALRRDLRAVYAEWALAEGRVEALRDVTASVRAGAVQFARRAEAGEESGLAARRVALAASELEAQLAQAEAAVLRARAAVRTWRPDLDDAAKPVLPELQAPPPEAPSAERPEVLALREEQRQAGFEKHLAGRWFGFPELRAGWQRLSFDGVTESGPVLGFGWTVPLFDRNQGARAEAAAREDAARARLVLAEARARAEGHGTRAAYARLAEAAKAARAATEGDSRMVAAALAAYRAGEAGLTDLLDTLRAARDARLRALEVLDAALAAHRDLEVALGRSLSDGGSR